MDRFDYDQWAETEATAYCEECRAVEVVEYDASIDAYRCEDCDTAVQDDDVTERYLL